MTETELRKDCCADWPKPCSYHEGWIDGSDQIAPLRAITDEQLATSAILVINWQMERWDNEDDPFEEALQLLGVRAEANGYRLPLVAFVEDPTADLITQIDTEDMAIGVVDHLIDRFNLERYRP